MDAELLDTNVLVHAAYRRSPLHVPAAQLVERALHERGAYCIAPQNLIEFAAVVTRRRAGQTPMAAEAVNRMTDLLYRSRTLRKIYQRRSTVMRAIREGVVLGIHGPTWYDLFLAVTMRDAGVRVIITENVADFLKFPFVTPRTIEEAVLDKSKP